MKSLTKEQFIKLISESTLSKQKIWKLMQEYRKTKTGVWPERKCDEVKCHLVTFYRWLRESNNFMPNSTQEEVILEILGKGE